MQDYSTTARTESVRRDPKTMITDVFWSPRDDGADTTGVSAEELACDGYIHDVCYSPQLDQLAYSSADGAVYIRQFSPVGRNMHLLGTLIGHKNEVVKIAWNAGDQTWVTGSLDKTVRVWSSSSSHECLLTIEMPAAIHALCIDHVAGAIVVGVDSTMTVLDPSDGKALQTNKEEGHVIRSISFSPSSKEYITSAWDGNICIWRAYQRRKCLL